MRRDIAEMENVRASSKLCHFGLKLTLISIPQLPKMPMASVTVSSSLVTLSALYFSPGLFFSDPSTHVQLGPLSDFHFPACTLTFVHNCTIYVLVALLGPRVRASDGSHRSFSWYVPMILFFPA